MQIFIYDKSYMYDMCIHVLITICDVYMYIYVVYILNVYTDLCIQNSLVCILFPEQTCVPVHKVRHCGRPQGEAKHQCVRLVKKKTLGDMHLAFREKNAVWICLDEKL